MLVMTNVGIVKIVKNTKEIIINPIVDLSTYSTTLENDNKYVALKSGYSLVNNTEIERLKNVSNYDDNEIRNAIAKCALQDDIPDVNKILLDGEYVTESKLNNKGYLTEHQNLDDYAKINDLPKFEFDADGTLIVTINGESHRYTPEIEITV
jgi:hypothetical protein